MLVTIATVVVETETSQTSFELTDLFQSGPPRDRSRLLEQIACDANDAWRDAVDEALNEAAPALAG
jgi:hypothetical protein